MRDIILSTGLLSHHHDGLDTVSSFHRGACPVSTPPHQPTALVCVLIRLCDDLVINSRQTPVAWARLHADIKIRCLAAASKSLSMRPTEITYRNDKLGVDGRAARR